MNFVYPRVPGYQRPPEVVVKADEQGHSRPSPLSIDRVEQTMNLPVALVPLSSSQGDTPTALTPSQNKIRLARRGLIIPRGNKSECLRRPWAPRLGVSDPCSMSHQVEDYRRPAAMLQTSRGLTVCRANLPDAAWNERKRQAHLKFQILGPTQQSDSSTKPAGSQPVLEASHHLIDRPEQTPPVAGSSGRSIAASAHEKSTAPQINALNQAYRGLTCTVAGHQLEQPAQA